MRARLLLALAAALAGAACLQERLDVDITTRIHPDGTCERRIEYRLEHTDTDKSGERKRVPIDPEKDGLRFQKLPSGERWQIRNEAGRDLHLVVAEALLPSPNDIGSDYSRSLSPRMPASSNTISYGCDKRDDEGEVCEYAEFFFDPASPPAVVRTVIRWMLSHDDDFATSVARALGASAPRAKALKKAYRDRFAEPLAESADRLASRQFFGPRERAELEVLMKDMDGRTDQLGAAVFELAPAAGPEASQKAVKDALEDIFKRFDEETPGAGAIFTGDSRRVHFKFTLVMPGPILRANTCFSGDTATWEFDDEDLYAHGFDIRARAGASAP